MNKRIRASLMGLLCLAVLQKPHTILMPKALPIVTSSHADLAVVPISPPVATIDTIQTIVETPKPTPIPILQTIVEPLRPVSGSHTDWLAAAKIGSQDWYCADQIITHESGWRPNATNPSSGAYGLPQSLPGSKMAAAGGDWATNPITQLIWQKGYVLAVYGGYCPAWSFWQIHHWY